MFTGIVQGQATVRSVSDAGAFRSLELAFPQEALSGISIGASVAVNGTCLTLTRQDGDTGWFDVISETLARTTLGNLAPGKPVNFERAARFGDEIGGHTVSGHICTTACIAADAVTELNRRLEFELADASWIKYIMPKGFVSVDGCSLTVGEVTSTSFSVYLIPETQRVTVLGSKTVGDAVNIEIDSHTQSIVDTVERTLQRFMGPAVSTSASAIAGA